MKQLNNKQLSQVSGGEFALALTKTVSINGVSEQCVNAFLEACQEAPTDFSNHRNFLLTVLTACTWDEFGIIEDAMYSREDSSPLITVFKV